MSWPVAEEVGTSPYPTELVRAARDEPELLDITSFGDPGPVYLEAWRGWRVECWAWWGWEG